MSWYPGKIVKRFVGKGYGMKYKVSEYEGEKKFTGYIVLTIFDPNYLFAQIGYGLIDVDKAREIYITSDEGYWYDENFSGRLRVRAEKIHDIKLSTQAGKINEFK